MTSSSPLSAHTLFLDRNFGRIRVAAEMRNLGLTVEVHEDHFPQAAQPGGEVSDEYWIRDITARGWIILTRNGRIRQNPLERRTFMECGARVFNIRNGSATADKVARCIQAAARKMQRIIDAESGAFIVGVSLSGDLTFIDRG